MAVRDALLGGVSKDSLAGAEEALESELAAKGGADVLGDELFAVADVLAESAGLRRGLTDPSRTPASRADLVQRLFTGKVGARTVATVAELARSRWSQPQDLTAAVDRLAVTCVLSSAESAGVLDEVEDELFRLGRAVAANSGLRDAVSARTQGRARKEELLHTLLDAKVRPQTLVLALRAVTAPRGRRPENVLEGFVSLAAARSSRHVAEVTTAVPLSAAQRTRLESALQRIYGSAVRLNVQLDPEVVGGLRVRLAGEVLDGTLLARLAAARRRLAG